MSPAHLPFGDTVQVARTADTIRVGWDPAASTAYAAYDVDVVAGDVVTLMGSSYSVKTVARWRSPYTGEAAGAVIAVETSQVAIPDTAVLYRITGQVSFDRATNVTTGPQRTQLWSGPVAISPASTDGTITSENGEQRVTLQTFRVIMPISVINIEPDDILQVTSSHDLWLASPAAPPLAAKTVELTVVRVLGGTEAVQREVLAVLNEG